MMARSVFLMGAGLADGPQTQTAGNFGLEVVLGIGHFKT
jgi:hypothetical protein